MVKALLALGAADPIMVIAHFQPAPVREDELKTRLMRLRDFVHAHVPDVTYRLYRSRTIFPAFQREDGPIPAGIVTRPVEPERFREVLE